MENGLLDSQTEFGRMMLEVEAELLNTLRKRLPNKDVEPPKFVTRHTLRRCRCGELLLLGVCPACSNVRTKKEI